MANPPVPPAEEEAEKLLAQARAARAAGRPDLALRGAGAALRAARASGDRWGEGLALLLQASILTQVEEHDPEEILSLSRSARSLLQEARDGAGEHEALRLVLSVEVKWQMYDTAAETAAACLEVALREGDSAATAAAQLALAEVRLEAGARDEAFRAATTAWRTFDELGDTQQAAACSCLLARIHLAVGEWDDCVDLATKARALHRTRGELNDEGAAQLLVARAYAGSGQHVLSLRAAEVADRLLRTCGNFAGQVDALVMIADTKLTITEEQVTGFATLSSIVAASEFALARAKRYRAEDRVCMAAATYTYARMLLRTNALKSAWVSAKAASRAFRKNGDTAGRARALLLWSEADLKLGYYNDARNSVQAALASFEQTGDSVGKNKCLDIEDDIDRACGIPTKAELIQQQQRQLQQQQQFMLMQMQQQQQQAAGGIQPLQMTQMAPLPEEEEAAAGKGGGTFTRTGSVLQVKAGMEVSVIRSKISEIALAIIGDDDEIHADTPLMEAGLTSTNAVVLRDELSKDLPGIKLPPTLIFDYPSIGTMADYVIELAG